MLDYDAEAATYDDTRGGVERARAAADAICSLVPHRGRCLDVAGGTGIVSAELAARGLELVVMDRSLGMLGRAAEQLPRRAVAGDATSLPFADRSVDVVTTLWLLHLVPDLVEQIVAEVARVLRPGGVWVTSVDKALGDSGARVDAGDSSGHVSDVAERAGLARIGSGQFEGTTKWSPDDGRASQTFFVVAFTSRADRPDT